MTPRDLMNHEWIRKKEQEALNIVKNDCLIIFQVEHRTLKMLKYLKILKTYLGLYNKSYDLDTKTIKRTLLG